jgi:hypothetical protein
MRIGQSLILVTALTLVLGGAPLISAAQIPLVNFMHRCRKLTNLLARGGSIRRHAVEQMIPQDQRVQQNSSKMGDEHDE